MKRVCDACGAITPSGISIGGAYICPTCEPEIYTEIDRLREAGERVNVRHIARRLLKEGGQGRWIMEAPPVKLWEEAKDLARDKKVSMRELVILAVDQYIDGRGRR